ncbi:hypothetical protein RIF29_09979 [Crotalaria pallida]|uniref:Uncharacterized protein n=1 Tax=Crotalaria pallida TaxID=3830 RepID=A0AAN9IJN7_CROPI
MPRYTTPRWVNWLTFKDINGLVEQNVQLRRLVRGIVCGSCTTGEAKKLKEFALDQPEVYEIKMGDQVFRRLGDPHLEFVERLIKNQFDKVVYRHFGSAVPPTFAFVSAETMVGLAESTKRVQIIKILITVPSCFKHFLASVILPSAYLYRLLQQPCYMPDISIILLLFLVIFILYLVHLCRFCGECLN